MNIEQRFKEYIAAENLFKPVDTLWVATSGGVDSVVLCELCHRCNFSFVIVHCNFQLREAESERDELFVKELAEKYKVDLHVKKFETSSYANEHKVSIQVAARELRYAWFHDLVLNAPRQPQHASNWLLTAHHADDNIETLLMNFFKGTGIAGLRAILPKQGIIIRPMLFLRKKEILEFATKNGLQYVEDSSNTSDKYTRNYFRHQVIPFLEEIFPNVETNLEDNLGRFRDIEILYNESIERIKKKLIERKQNEIHLPVLKLKKTPAVETILFEICRPYGFSSRQAAEIVALLDSETGKYIQSHSHRILRNRNWLIITPNQPQSSETILIESASGELAFGGGELQLRSLPSNGKPIPTSPDIACLDAAHIRFPLILRRWKKGDYFYPLGMLKKKKLSRFFIDLKMSLPEKENTWVIEMDKKILWVIGRRIDDRFKITSATKQLLEIKRSASGSK